MSERTEKRHQVVIRNNNTTEVWNKNSAGSTTKEGHSTYHHKSGYTTDHYGKIISEGGRDGRKTSK